MKSSVLCVVLFSLCASFVVVASARSEASYAKEFSNFVTKFHKKYDSKEETTRRFGIFSEKLDQIDAHNAQKKSFTRGINKFSDLTAEEYRQYLGFVASPHAPKNPHKTSGNNFKLPTSVDWRNESAVTDIKDQGQCGSCWAFSTTGTIEGFHAIHSKNLVSLSEQNLIDCTWGEPYNNTGCDGGDMRTSLQYVVNNKGIDTEDSYSYDDYYGGDQENCSYTKSGIGATISAFMDVVSGNETDLAYAVLGCPVSVAIDASQDSFQDYDGGIYYEPACNSDLNDLDHGVLVVGYGSEDDDDYWIVKNSWGPEWGMEGFILMSRNQDNNCGIATYATVPTK